MTTPQQYRKKPVVVEAMQFTGGAENATLIIDWVMANGGTANWTEAFETFELEGTTVPGKPEHIEVYTLEGVMMALVGWWIIRGVAGEFYPCAPSVFAQTYEGGRGMSDRYVAMVREFHQACGVESSSLDSLSAEAIELRINLINEEGDEAVDAMYERDPIGTAKELGDLLYVTFGAALRFGIPIADVFAAVHESNMSKLGEDGRAILREDGKVLKGPNYIEPDIASILTRP